MEDADGDMELYYRACLSGKVQPKKAVFFPVCLLEMAHGSVRAFCHGVQFRRLLLQILQSLALSQRAGSVLMDCPFLPSGAR